MVLYAANTLSMTINGKVIRGHGLGRKLGFPTINVEYDGEEDGVFVGNVAIGKREYGAAVHIGEKATIEEGLHSCEAYLLDFDEELSEGTEIGIELLEKIRDTKKFDDFQQLGEQIADDVEFVKNWYNLQAES